MEYREIPIYHEHRQFNSYQNELMNLFEFIKTTHPAFIVLPQLEATMKEQVEVLCELLADESQWTLPKFQVQLNKLLTNLEDAHTFIETIPSNPFPFNTRFYEGDFYIYATTAPHQAFLGKVISAINDIPISTIHKQMSLYVSSENSIKRGISGSFYLNNPDFLEALGVDIKDGELTITFSDDTKEAFHLNEEKESFMASQPQLHPITSKKEDLFHYEIVDSICYFQFNGMFDRLTYQIGCRLFGQTCNEEILNSIPDFEEFLKNMFAEMETKHIQTLVVDMRNNGGGNSMLGDMLLEALLPEDKSFKSYDAFIRVSDFVKTSSTYFTPIQADAKILINTNDLPKIPEWENHIRLKQLFTGKVIFIQGQNTFSSANYLLTTIHDNHLFQTIGTETSQRPTCFGDIMPIILPFTKTKGFISHSYLKRPCSDLDNESTLHPNVLIKDSFYNKLRGIDPQMEWIRDNCDL